MTVAARSLIEILTRGRAVAVIPGPKCQRTWILVSKRTYPAELAVVAPREACSVRPCMLQVSVLQIHNRRKRGYGKR